MDDVETRTVMTLRTGSKICVLIGLALLVLCVYFLFVPVTSVRTSSGGVFGCGTALSPAGGSFAHGVCGDVTQENRYRAFASLAICLITVVAGVLMFGVDRREEHRAIPRSQRDRDTGRGRDRDWDDDRFDESSVRHRHTDRRHDDRAEARPPRRHEDDRPEPRATRHDDDRPDDDERASRRSVPDER
ncbi:hypothetical protein [Flexivirga caeni]|uniref:Uncharacterized protein n=1 Tax=Flexivirga caeni TaxID=2294115 RepID=A0A3M9LVF5_9MICO|nr:hypothetical protein [Flexivirga caeni]RNI17290.1 hypothetical protein EFY87_19410 [Flexivirga caeni]